MFQRVEDVHLVKPGFMSSRHSNLWIRPYSEELWEWNEFIAVALSPVFRSTVYYDWINSLWVTIYIIFFNLLSSTDRSIACKRFYQMNPPISSVSRWSAWLMLPWRLISTMWWLSSVSRQPLRSTSLLPRHQGAYLFVEFSSELTSRLHTVKWCIKAALN